MTTKKRAARSLAGNQDQAVERMDIGVSDSIIAASQNERKFSFRWGILMLDAAQRFTPIYDFMLFNYHRVTGRYTNPIEDHKRGDEWHGVTRQEFLVIVHLAARHYETARGESSPSLRTVAKEMGISWRGLQKIIYSLEAKGMLEIERRPGRTSVYSCRPFAMACYGIWLLDQENKAEITHELEDKGEPHLSTTHEPQFVTTHEPQFVTPTNPSSSETEENRRMKHNNNVAVVSSQPQRSDEGGLVPADKDAALKHLLALGMFKDIAQKLSSDNDPKRVISVARVAQGMDNPPGFARRALEQGWEVADPDATVEEDLRIQAKSCQRGYEFALQNGGCPLASAGVVLAKCQFCDWHADEVAA